MIGLYTYVRWSSCDPSLELGATKLVRVPLPVGMEVASHSVRSQYSTPSPRPTMRHLHRCHHIPTISTSLTKFKSIRHVSPKAAYIRLHLTTKLSRPFHKINVCCVNCRVKTFAASNGGSSSQLGSNSSRNTSSSLKSLPDSSPLPSFVRRHPRIQVSSLLADPYTRFYHLEVVQHPQRAAAFGNASLSRLPLTPPIIVQLTVRDPTGNSIVPDSELPFLIAHLSLFSENGLTSLDMGSYTGPGRPPPILYGNLVSSVSQLEDLQGNMGLFFLFPDVSIRWRGRFQLGISLVRISGSDSPGPSAVGEQGIVLAETRTRTFEVVPQSQYVAAPQTRLTQCFLRQDARMFAFMPHP